MVNLLALEDFIVLAKSLTYIGGQKSQDSCRRGSHDISYDNNQWSYLDSYFGGTDFFGQEVVWESSIPVWVMNYYGRILLPKMIDAERAGSVIKESLSELYKEGRFLGGFSKDTEYGLYIDESEGNANRFFGTEKILIDNLVVYQLDYHGGLVKP